MRVELVHRARDEGTEEAVWGTEQGEREAGGEGGDSDDRERRERWRSRPFEGGNRD